MGIKTKFWATCDNPYCEAESLLCNRGKELDFWLEENGWYIYNGTKQNPILKVQTFCAMCKLNHNQWRKENDTRTG